MPKHLCYFLLSLVLTGLIASAEANSSQTPQTYLTMQQDISSLWDYLGLTNPLRLSHDNHESNL
ncbi:MAG: hypothetical protein AAGI69_26760 [Cyanobacteria bacterium P01_H01_bin.21]